jgi:hypothetical protein
MRPFRFRAQAALHLRRREHDHALAHLAQTQSVRSVVAREADASDRTLVEADQRLAQALRASGADTPLDWYRSWRLRCAAERERQHRRLGECDADVRAAERTVMETYRRVRSLERLHDLAHTAWQRAALQEEQKTMDALATIKFARRKDGQ